MQPSGRGQGPFGGVVVQRTRDALGDIGNRIAKKNGAGAEGLSETLKPVKAPSLAKPGVVAINKSIASNKETKEKTNLKSAVLRCVDKENIKKPSKATAGNNTFKVPSAISLKGSNAENKVKLNTLNRAQEKVTTLKPKENPLKARNVNFTNNATSKENKKSVILRASADETDHKKCDPSILDTKDKKDISKVEKTTIGDASCKGSFHSFFRHSSSCPELPTDKLVDITEEQEDSDNGLADDKVELDEEFCNVGFSSQRYDVRDIDAEDGKNIILLPMYIGDIFKYLFALERKFPIKIRYLEGRLVNSRMRAVLLDWLVEVHYQFGFSPETLYIACKTLDRYLQKDRAITRKQLQLVGVTAMYIAAKYEEVSTPTIVDFSTVSDNAFTVAEVRKMEMDMLVALDYDMSPPPAVFFLRRFSKAAGVSNGMAPVIVHTMAKYIMELTLLDYGTCHLFPSQQAAASLALSMLILDKDKSLSELWTPTMEHYSRVSLKHLKEFMVPVCRVVSTTHEATPKLKAVFSKYSRNRLSRVSTLPELELKEWKERVFKELC